LAADQAAADKAAADQATAEKAAAEKAAAEATAALKAAAAEKAAAEKAAADKALADQVAADKAAAEQAAADANGASAIAMSANGWHLTMKPLDKPVAGSTMRFRVVYERSGTGGPSGRMYLEQGFYWFTQYNLASCTATNATCDWVGQTFDRTATGVENAMMVQAITANNGPARVELVYTVKVPSDPRCTFYTVAYNDDPTNPIIVSPPSVHNFGCS
jgi:hypothetical protein